MTSPYYRVAEVLDTHEYDIYDMTPKEIGELVYKVIQTLDIQISEFKDNRKSLFKLYGVKVMKSLIAYQDTHGADVYLGSVTLGKTGLYDSRTLSLAQKLTNKMTDDDQPGRFKVELGVRRNDKPHLQFLQARKYPPPKTIKVGKNVHTVTWEIVGQAESWRDVPYIKQLRQATTYMYKPANDAAAGKHNKLDLRRKCFADWFLEQRELHKLTPNQRKKLGKHRRPTLTWNRNC
ncbi:hypothetical protein DEDE109153_10715 [Deinococcus deserti]|uniref:Uncharacterized protein n=1 Tax=Deinococcus deserti (strain DSM 17065 / CIP 109153 / LMG 22923 / VCD115) TaxID=546414 RepID=C1CX45_DEIDV|nr:hypothetical protein [Deinococcus deserti]ACO46762.1 Hypothetical protein Deide_17822 [Deinococcus deserti VCD115]